MVCGGQERQGAAAGTGPWRRQQAPAGRAGRLPPAQLRLRLLSMRRYAVLVLAPPL